MLATYDEDRVRLAKDPLASLTADESRIKWSRALENAARKAQPLTFTNEAVRAALFRPFQRQWVYFYPALNDQQYSLNRLSPTVATGNLGFYAVNPGSDKPWSVLMTDLIPDLSMYGSGSGQFFARWRYEPVGGNSMLDLDDGEVVDGYRRIDNITNEALEKFISAYGKKITKDDIFYYVYGLLHSPEYRMTYGADLKKMLPHIPFVEDPWPFVKAGGVLSDLHIGYETVEPYRLSGLDAEPVGDPYDFYRVEKMAFAKVRIAGKLTADRSTIVCNSKITLTGIPEDTYRYMLGSRSAVEWILERYQVKTDKDSGIVSDPNDWAREVGDARYIVDLLARIVTVSVETTRIVDGLPPLAIRETQ